MRRTWGDLLDGNYRLEHVYSRRTRPRMQIQGSEIRPRATNALVLYHDGLAEMQPPGSGFRAEPCCLAYYPAGSLYRVQVETPRTLYDQVEFSLTDPAGEETALADHPVVLFPECPAVYRVKMAEMVRVHEHGGLASALKSNSLLYDLLYRLVLDRFMEESKLSGYQRILPAILHLEQHYMNNVTVTSLARMSAMSVSSFRRAFGRYSGQGPLEYRNNLRIRYACDLLKVGDHNVSEVAELTGFGNVQYFSRVFRKATGNAPGDLRYSVRD
ncbi:MAG: AraC family transcriptional regulator [Lentisphaeria bacterium]|nr:AraC family transcriptional regulator [Lentisphaeria bacterium]